MAGDDPAPAAAEPHAAFYGLWPRFAEPVERRATPPLRRERPTRHICGWWTADAPQGLRIA